MKANPDGLDDGCTGCGCDPCIGSSCPGRTNGYWSWRRASIVLLALAALLVVSSCTTPSAADQAAYNASVAADNFEVNRLIVGINLHTGETLFSVQGACSITRDGDLVVTCKEGPNLFKKHYFGLGPAAGEGVTYVSTQLDPVVASQYHTRIILRPTTFVPDFDLDLGSG